MCTWHQVLLCTMLQRFAIVKESEIYVYCLIVLCVDQAPASSPIHLNTDNFIGLIPPVMIVHRHMEITNDIMYMIAAFQEIP